MRRTDMILNYTNSIPYVAVPALAGSLAVSFFSSSEPLALLGAVMGVGVYYLARFLINEIVRKSHQNRSRV